MPTAQRPKILLLIPHLGGGGAEQVTALLARGLSHERYELHLGVITQTREATEPLPSWVSLHPLGARRVRTSAFRLLFLVWQLQPDVILSGMAHLNFLVLLLRPLFPQKTRVLVRQNGTVSDILAFGDLPGYTRLLYRLLYHRADRVICQTQAMAGDLTMQIAIAENQLAVLPNPVDVEEIQAAAEAAQDQWAGPGPHLLAVGRLVPAKGFDLLLKALAAVRERFPDTDLTIAGTGPLETALKDQCRELGLEQAVHFAGHVAQPAAFFPGASLFVLSSRHEGLPNALLEAAAGGLPLVALPASGGVSDLLRNQPGAWLSPESSAEGLAYSLLDALEALQPGQRFVHPFLEAFRFERAIPAYEALIDAVLPKRRL
jgi:glycosyltransferase involved in cell wall biosynthesis